MKRKCKQFIAMFLAMSTVLSGCASDLNFYADELSSDSVLESELVVSSSDESELVEDSSESLEDSLEESSTDFSEILESSELSESTEASSTEETEFSESTEASSTEEAESLDEFQEESEITESSSEAEEGSVSSGDALLPEEDLKEPEVDGSFVSNAEGISSMYVQVGVGGSISLNDGSTYITITRDAEEHASVAINDSVYDVHVHHTGLFKLGQFFNGTTITVQSNVIQGYKVSQYVVSTDTGDTIERKEEFTESPYTFEGTVQASSGLSISVDFVEENEYDLYVDITGIGTFVLTKDDVYYWFESTEGGILVTDEEANEITLPLSPDGYYYLGSYLEGSVFHLDLAFEGEESVSYAVKSLDGLELETNTGLGYLTTDMTLSQNSCIFATLGNQEEDLSWLDPAINWDWRASTDERGIYYFEGVDDPEYGVGKVYWGETVVELIAMYNEGVIAKDVDWGVFFENTIFADTDYEGLLFLYKNGYTFEDLATQCADLVCPRIWDVINGTIQSQETYASKLGSWGQVVLKSSKKAIIPSIYGDYNWYNVLDMLIVTPDDKLGARAFCIDPKRGMPQGTIVYVADESVSSSNMFEDVTLGQELAIREALGNYTDVGGGLLSYSETRLYMWAITAGGQHVQDTFMLAYADFTATVYKGYNAVALINDRWRKRDNYALIKNWARRGFTTTLSPEKTDWARCYADGYLHSVADITMSGDYWGSLYMWTDNGTTTSKRQRLITWYVPKNTHSTPPKTPSTPNKGDGEITAVKRGVDGSLYEGAVFQVVSSRGQTVGFITTDSSGTGSLKVTPGTYLVKEVTPPANCELVDTVFKCTVSANTGYSAEVSVEDPPLIRYGWLRLRKTNSYGVALNGCTFGVFTDSGCSNQVATLTSNKDMTVGVELEEGVYYVKELSCPAIYELDPTIHTCYITAETGYDFTVNAVNPFNKVFIKVDKRDIDTGEEINVIPNFGTAAFQILTLDYRIVIQEFYGYGSVPIDPGTYWLRETRAPGGYALAEDQMFTVTDAQRTQTVTLYMYDKANEYEFLKLNADTKQPVAGAGLALFKENGSIYEQWTTDGTPHKIKGLPSGRYILRELSVPSGYLRAEPVIFTVDSNVTELQTITMYNSPRTLSIYKVDQDTGEGLSGAELELWTVDSNDNPKVMIDKWTSDGTAHVLSGVTLDRYAVIERKAPDGYDLVPKTIIEFGHQHSEAAGCYVQHQHGDSCPQSCVEYCGGEDGNSTDGYWSDANGIISGGWCPNCGLFEGIVGCPGLHETEPCMNGKKVDSNTHCLHLHHLNCNLPPFELRCTLQENSTGSQVYYIYNKKTDGPNKDKITVSVEKVGPNTSDVFVLSKLGGAVLQIKNASGTVVKQWTTTAGSNAVFTDLTPGNYTLVEVQAPAGYVKANDVPFTVRNTTTTQTVTMKDEVIKLSVKKLTKTGDYLGGAKLQILTSTGAVYDEWTTVWGVDHIVYGIPAGNYVLHEVSAPQGYRIAADVPFTVQETIETQTVTMIDEPLYLAIDKVDEVTGKSLRGAQLQLWTTVNNDGVTKDTLYISWTSSGEPKILTQIPLGKYILVETNPPIGYVREEFLIEVTGICNTTIRGIEMESHNIKDQFIKLDVNKTDIHTGYAVPNCELYLWYADENGNSLGRLADTWISDGKPHRVDRLAEGWYRLEEVDPATGYSVADPLIFYVDEKAEVQSQTMKNDYLFVGFELSKVDGITGEFIGDKADDYGDESITQFELWEYNNQLGDYEISKDYKIVYTGKGHYSVATTIDWAKDGFLYWRPDTSERAGNSGLFKYREVKAPYGYELDDEFVYIDIIKCQELNDDWTVVRENPNGGKPWVEYHAHNESYEEYLIYDNNSFANEESRGTFEIRKWDTDRAETDLGDIPQGDAKLEGFEFTIYNRGVRPIWYYPEGMPSKDYDGNIKDRVLVNVGEPVCVITTNSLGTAKTADLGLPYGTYEVVETKAGEGYMNETNNFVDRVGSITFTIDSYHDYVVADFDGTYGFPNQEDQIIGQKYIKNDVIRGGVQIQKWDVELDKSEAIGGGNHGNNEKGTHLEGITFDIKNVSNKHTEYDVVETVTKVLNEETGEYEERIEYLPDPATAKEVGSPVYVEGVWYEYNTVVKSITTHWNEELGCYTAETGTDTLPYGTYEIYEVATTDSYLLNDKVHTFQIREDGVIVTEDINGDLIVTKDQVVRGDVRFVKIEEATHRFMKVPFLVMNITTGEQHVIVTDTNGQINSARVTDEDEAAAGESPVTGIYRQV